MLRHLALKGQTLWRAKCSSLKYKWLLSVGDLFRLFKNLRTEPYPNFYSRVPQATTIRDLEFDANDAVSHTQILR